MKHTLAHTDYGIEFSTLTENGWEREVFDNYDQLKIYLYKRGILNPVCDMLGI